MKIINGNIIEELNLGSFVIQNSFKDKSLNNQNENKNNCKC